MKKDLITAGFSAAEIIALGFTQFGCGPAPVAPINNENNTITTENNPQQSNEVLKITSADLTMFKAENQKKDIISSLPSDRPKNKNDNFDVFKVKIGEENIKFVMYEIEDEEVLNGVAITTQSNGQEIISIQNIALFTEVIEFGGTKRWERLIATNPSLNGENTVWIYDPNGYPTEARPINTDRAVFGYNHNGTNVLVQPIIIDPNQIEGYDNTQALPVVLVDTPSLMKNASPIKLEATTESPLPVIEGLTHNVEEKFWKFEDKASDTTLVFAEQSVGKKIKDGILELGVWDLNVETGEFKVNTNIAPQSIEQAKEMRKIIVISGHPMEAEMLKTIRIATEQSLKKSGTYDPAQEFSGITITDKVLGKTIEDVDVTPKDWMIHAMYDKIDLVDIFPTSKRYDNGSENRFYVRNRAARPIQIAVNGTGFFNVQIIDDNNTLLYDLISIPVVAMNANQSIITLTALERMPIDTNDITRYFNTEKRPYLSPTLIANGDYTASEKTEERLPSDPELRELITEFNKPFMANFNNYNISLPYIPNVVQSVFLSTAIVEDLSR